MRSLARTRDADDLGRRLKRLRPTSAARWGRMSAHQMVCHVSDALRMAVGAKAVSDATSLYRQTILKWIVLYAPVQWPRGIPTRPEIDQACGGTAPADFARDVAQLEMLMHQVASESVSWSRHPIFGRMSPRQWQRWAYLHTDHHLRQFGV